MYMNIMIRLGYHNVNIICPWFKPDIKPICSLGFGIKLIWFTLSVLSTRYGFMIITFK